MRKALDFLYGAFLFAAAAALAALLAIVLAQIAGRLVGVLVPSAVEIGGFLMAGSSFLALAHVLRNGGHIRVTLLLGRLDGLARRALEAACAGLAAALAIFFAWNCLDMTIETWALGEVSAGLVPVPMWIPQAVMCLGVWALAIALVDALVTLLAGRNPPYLGQDASTH